ncbi:MAG: hypothetical protein AB1578_15125, partial [Thermodesulfobacteriota bacterium]
GRPCLTCPTGHGRTAAAALAALLLLWAPGTLWAQKPPPRSPGQDRLVVGLKAFEDGFHDLAAKELRAFLTAAPGDPRRAEVLAVLAQAELLREDWPGARQALGELAAAGGPGAREAPYWLGWVAAREAKLAEALGHLEAYLGQEGGDHRADALYLAGDLARRLGKAAVAAGRFARFLETAASDPRRPSAWLGLVEARAGDDPAAAREAARRALAEPGVAADAPAAEALALAGIAAARGSGDPASEAPFWAFLAGRARDGALRQRARYEEGAALARVGDGPDGRAEARRALQAYLLASPKGPHAATAHLLLADLAQKAPGADRARALEHLEAALGFATDPAVAPRVLELRRAALGLALATGDGARAAGHARALLGSETALPPEDRARVRFALAGAAPTPDEALVHWDAVPAATAPFRDARLLAARALLDANRPAEALARLEPLLGAEDPGSEAHLTALAAAEAAGDHPRVAALAGHLAERLPPGTSPAELLHRRALALQAAGDETGYAQALEALAAHGPGDPRGAWAAAELAARAFGQGQWEEVLRWSRAGPPGAPTYREAEALYRLGRTGEAQTAFETLASREGPDRAPALARLGTLRDQAGDARGAAEAYRAALAAGLPGEAAVWVQERLKALAGEEREGQR